MTEGEAIKLVDDALSALDADAQRRVLDWARLKFLGETARLDAKGSTANEVERPRPSDRRPKSRQKPKSRKKAKLIIRQLKDLNLNPKDAQSALDFSSEKQPTNLKQKCVAAIYYLKFIIEIDQVSISHVHTFFKNVGWPTPTDLFNTLHQSGTEGWLDTSDAEDLKVTSSGENLIEHGLPKKKG